MRPGEGAEEAFKAVSDRVTTAHAASPRRRLECRRGPLFFGGGSRKAGVRSLECVRGIPLWHSSSKFVWSRRGCLLTKPLDGRSGKEPKTTLETKRAGKALAQYKVCGRRSR